MRFKMPSRGLALSILGALVALAVIPALAHPPATLRVVAHFLDLSEEQTQGVVEVRADAHEQSEPLIQEIAAQRAALKELVEGDDPNAEEVGTLLLTIRDLERQVGEIQTTATEEIRSSLDEEQLRRLQAVKRAQPLCRVSPAFQALNLI